ncbi:CDP-diacylglycerol--serine O-phosphatidyltransferase [Amylibacter marinus]|uniref:CDP-diacylglycerol--serine O-phosphatidyltransferase n=2 Tax=Amylibacter marinus TaxID=1475483 RepID=A0ABQ5VSG9_9RHOB|nr:CDP-diacylglycerol--serine O-phosphatidyltransferase [Amylibacter marinus]
MVTIFSICAGLTALRMGIEGNVEKALYLIMLAVFLDAADGKLARMLKSSSDIGAELDTLADFFNFGIVPGILVYTVVFDGTEQANLGWFTVLTMAAACALRLARFNVTSDDAEDMSTERNYFVGVPAPAFASLSLMPIFLQLLNADWVFSPHLVSIYLLLMAALAISRIPTYSIKHASVKSKHVALLLFGSTLVMMSLLVFTWQTFVVANVLYLLSLPLSVRCYRRQNAG